MTYEGIDYAIRAGLGRNEWVLLLSFPDNVGGNPSVVNFSGSRNNALAEAKKRINNWMKRLKKKKASGLLGDLALPILLKNERFQAGIHSDFADPAGSHTSFNDLVGSREQGAATVRPASCRRIDDELELKLVGCRTGKKCGLGRPIQPPMLLWPKPLDLRLERGFDRPVRRLNGDHARPGIGDTASLADALDLRTLLREFASAQD